MPARIPVKTRLVIVASAAFLYVVACALPAVSLENGDRWLGVQVVWMGGMGIFVGQFAWFAHLPAACAVVTLMIGLRRTTIVLSSLAALFALHMFVFPGTVIPLDEGGVNKARVLALGPAAWVWLAALVTPGIGAFLGRPPRRASLG